jgi:hypothetical protein
MRPVTRALAVVAVVMALGGCTTGRGPSNPSAGPPIGASPGSVSPVPGSVSPVPGSSSATESPPTGCLVGTVSVIWTPDQPSPPAVCVRAHAEISVVLAAPYLHQWSPPVSSDSTVAAVATSGANQEGTMYATVNATRAGTTVVTALAQPREGADDPRPVPWRLAVTVVP